MSVCHAASCRPPLAAAPRERADVHRRSTGRTGGGRDRREAPGQGAASRASGVRAGRACFPARTVRVPGFGSEPFGGAQHDDIEACGWRRGAAAGDPRQCRAGCRPDARQLVGVRARDEGQAREHRHHRGRGADRRWMASLRARAGAPTHRDADYPPGGPELHARGPYRRVPAAHGVRSEFRDSDGLLRGPGGVPPARAGRRPGPVRPAGGQSAGGTSRPATTSSAFRRAR